MATEHGTEASGGLSRRQLLARGAVAGGLVWAAPIIRTTAAYATTANGTERPCINFYMVVINPAGNVRPGPGSLNGKEIPPAIRQWFADNPAVPVQFPAARPLLTAANGDVWAVLLPEVTGPNAAGRQCRMVLGWGAKGRDFAEGYVDPNPPLAIEVGRRLLFPCPDRSGGHDDNDDENGLDGDGDTDGDHLGEAGALSSSGVASDGSGNGGLSGDGRAGSLTSDGTASVRQQTGPGSCLDAVYLIFCCPR